MQTADPEPIGIVLFTLATGGEKLLWCGLWETEAQSVEEESATYLFRGQLAN